MEKFGGSVQKALPNGLYNTKKKYYENIITLLNLNLSFLINYLSNTLFYKYS